MKLILIGMFDRKAQMYISLEPTPNINVALRQLTENVNKESDSPIYKWPEDYSLWELGSWDNETGQPRQSEQKKLIIECESLKQRS